MVQSELVAVAEAPLLPQMTADEARACIADIKEHATTIRARLLELYERRGWEALGYDSWRECVVAEFEQSQAALYFQLQAAQIERRISNTLENAPIPLRQLLPLASLTPIEQPAAWQRAVETAPNGKMTAAHVEQTVREWEAPAVPVAPPTVSDKEVISVIKSGAQQVIDHAKSQWIGNAYRTDEETRRENLDRWREIENKISEVIQPAKLAPLMSSASPEWYTPQHIINKVHDMLGGIDLDPASSLEAQETVEAGEWFGLDHPDPRCRDGLKREWHGKVYMNPPYGDVIGDWVHRLVHQYDMNITTEAIALLPGRIDTGWFQPLIERGLAWCIVRGRLKFSGADNSAPFPSVIVYFGDDIPRFCHHFRDLGPIVALYE